jgi:hypothetical protein
VGTGASRTVGAPVSHQKARISFDLHGFVTWMSTPRTALEPLDRSSQPARLVVLNDPRLQVDRVDHRSLAGCSMHNLGSGQRVAARARWRGRASRRTSAVGLCCSEQVTMCVSTLVYGTPLHPRPRSSSHEPALPSTPLNPPFSGQVGWQVHMPAAAMLEQIQPSR